MLDLADGGTPGGRVQAPAALAETCQGGLARSPGGPEVPHPVFDVGNKNHEVAAQPLDDLREEGAFRGSAYSPMSRAASVRIAGMAIGAGGLASCRPVDDLQRMVEFGGGRQAGRGRQQPVRARRDLSVIGREHHMGRATSAAQDDGVEDVPVGRRCPEG